MRLFLAAVAVAAPALAEVKAFPSNKHDVTKFRTYQWKEPPRLIQQGQDNTTSPLIEAIKGIVDKRLAERGYREVAEGGDMQVVVGAVAAKASQIEGYLVTFGFDAYWGFWFGMPYPVQTMNRIGLLFVGLIETASKEGVWAGYATEAIDRQGVDVARTTAKADKAARKLFRKLPASR